MNPLVSQVHDREVRWSEEFKALRGVCLATGLTESLKWGQACYGFEGRNIVLIHGFKAYCALLFMKGAMLKDPAAILVQQTQHVQAARQIRFQSLADILAQGPAIERYLEEAIALEKSGARVVMKTVEQYEVPKEFQDLLDSAPALLEAFRALTPGRQKAYLIHFATAKQSSTRVSRVQKQVPRILAGLGLDD